MYRHNSNSNITTSVQHHDPQRFQKQREEEEQNSNILNKPVLVVARVRDFAPLEDPSRRSVFVTGQRTCFVQLPHQRGKVEFAMDAVIGGNLDVDPRSGEPLYHPQIHHQQQQQQKQQNGYSAYSYHSSHQNLLSSPPASSTATVGSGSQQSVFDTVGAPLVDCLVQGRNATVISYGATSS